MADPDRTAAPVVTLYEALQQGPYRFDFFQAIRRLECAHADRPRVGHALRPAGEPVRLSQEASLAFAPSTLASFEPPAEGRAGRLAVFFLGLFGPNGPLPLHLTEYARDRLRNADDPTFGRFADLFHHRLLSFFYRAWSGAQPTVSFDRPDSDRFAVYLGSLVGLGMPALRDREPVPDLAKFHFAGLLSNQTRHADGLGSLLAGYFGMRVRIQEFVGQWVDLPERSRWRLGESPETGALGRTTIAGSRIWQCQLKFRIVFGPLDLEEYLRLQPGSDSLARLVALVRAYVGDELDWDVQVILKRDQLPPLVLGESARLGRTTWCGNRPPERDVEDLFLHPLGVAA